MAQRLDEAVSKLHDNNQKLFKKFQKFEHPKLGCCGDDEGCAPTFKSLVFNGYIANTNMAAKKGTPFKDLKNCLDEYRSQSTEHTATILIFTGVDGLFTNVLGVRESFSNYGDMNLFLYMYDGGNDLLRYDLVDLLDAIDNFNIGVLKPTSAQELVHKWALVALYKERLSEAQERYETATGATPKRNRCG